MLAILSDIHGNLEALHAVLADIEARTISKIYCLGDTIGYGPDPSACVDIVRKFDLSLGGNWEQFVVETPMKATKGPIERLRREYEWNRGQLTKDQLQFLTSLKSCTQMGTMTFAHACPLDYLNGYLFPEHIYDTEHMDRVFAAFDGVFVCGHTHMAGVHLQTEYYEPSQIDFRFRQTKKPSIINVGSVGQPRDKDLRASYVVFDGDSFEFVRVEYDRETTLSKLDELGF